MRDKEILSEDIVTNYNTPAKPTSKKFKDLSGLIIGELEVIKLHRLDRKNSHWIVKCSCGRYDVVSATKLRGDSLKCFWCGKNRSKTEEELTKEILNFCLNNNYTFLGIIGDYISVSKTKCRLQCNVDGNVWEPTIQCAVNNKTGCSKCSAVKQSNLLRKPSDQFIKQSKVLFGVDTFDYSKVNYIKSSEKVKITCKKHDYSFEQSPNNHLKGKVSCPLCLAERTTHGGFNKTKQATLYLLEGRDQVTGFTFLKFGITNRPIMDRISHINRKSKYYFKLLKSITGYGEDIYNMELDIKHNFTTGVILKEDMLSGFTETINIECLEEILKYYGEGL